MTKGLPAVAAFIHQNFNGFPFFIHKPLSHPVSLRCHQAEADSDKTDFKRILPDLEGHIG